MTAGRGVIVERNDGEKWLLFDCAMLRVPDGVNVIAALKIGDKPFIRSIFNEFSAENISTADLTGAELPTPDASASKIIRIFTDADGGRIGVTNKDFALIEKGDNIYTVYDDKYSEETPAALLVTVGFGDNEEITGMIFNDDYFCEKINEKE